LFFVVDLCTHQREKDTHGEREKSVETVSIATSQERRNKREKTNMDWKKPAKQHRRNKERFAREKQKQNKKNNREEETLHNSQCFQVNLHLSLFREKVVVRC